MTLDLSEYEATTDTPEVAALKAKVVAVSKKYTAQHGWCGEVNRALREMGIEQAPTPLTVHVTTKHPFEFDVRVDVVELLGKTEAQQKTVVLNKIGTLYLNGGTAVRSAPSFKLTAADITDLSLPPKVAGENWLYGSDRGQVRHHFTTATLTDARDRGRTYAYPDCGMEFRTSNLSTTSPRGSGQNCDRCTKAAVPD
jgi:hypothetical protein